MALAAASSLLLEAVMARFAVCCSALVLCTCQPGSAPLTGLQSSEAGSSIKRVAVLPVRLAATWLPAALRLEIVRRDAWRVQSRRSLTVVLLRTRVLGALDSADSWRFSAGGARAFLGLDQVCCRRARRTRGLAAHLRLQHGL